MWRLVAVESLAFGEMREAAARERVRERVCIWRFKLTFLRIFFLIFQPRRSHPRVLRIFLSITITSQNSLPYNIKPSPADFNNASSGAGSLHDAGR